MQHSRPREPSCGKGRVAPVRSFRFPSRPEGTGAARIPRCRWQANCPEWGDGRRHKHKNTQDNAEGTVHPRSGKEDESSQPRTMRLRATFRCKVNRPCSSFDTIRRERRPERRVERFEGHCKAFRRGLPARTVRQAGRDPHIDLQAASLWRDCVRSRHEANPVPRAINAGVRSSASPKNKLSAVATLPRAPSGVGVELFRFGRQLQRPLDGPRADRPASIRTASPASSDPVAVTSAIDLGHRRRLQSTIGPTNRQHRLLAFRIDRRFDFIYR